MHGSCNINNGDTNNCLHAFVCILGSDNLRELDLSGSRCRSKECSELGSNPEQQRRFGGFRASWNMSNTKRPNRRCELGLRLRRAQTALLICDGLRTNGAPLKCVCITSITVFQWSLIFFQMPPTGRAGQRMGGWGSFTQSFFAIWLCYILRTFPIDTVLLK